MSLSGIIKGKMHYYPVRIYFEDTDAGGLVYHANYLKYAERARTEMLRCFDYPHSKLMSEEGVMFVARRCEMDFIRPAKLDQELLIHTSVSSYSGVRLCLKQDIFLGDSKLVGLNLEIASVSLDGVPKRLPKTFMKVLEKYLP